MEELLDQNLDNDKINLKLKKLKLALKVIRGKFLKQMEMIKYAPKDKLSHVLLRNTLVIRCTMERIKSHQLDIVNCVSKIKKCKNENEKKVLSSEINEKQILIFILLKNLTDLFDNYPIFEHDYEIVCLSNKNLERLFEKVPKAYHEIAKKEIMKIKPEKLTRKTTKPNEKVVENFFDLNDIVDGLKDIVGVVEDGLYEVGDFVMDLLDDIKYAFEVIFDAMEDIFNKMKEIVEFVGGILIEVIDIFFKILQFIWQLVTKWVPWFVEKAYYYFLEWFDRLDIFGMIYVLSIFFDLLVSAISEKVVTGLDLVLSVIPIGQLIAFYVFWIYPKTCRKLQNKILDTVKDLLIWIINSAKDAAYTAGELSEDAAGALISVDAQKAKEAFKWVPSPILYYFREIFGKFNEDISSFTADDLDIVEKSVNFSNWLGENIGLFIIKVIILITIFYISKKYILKHIGYGIPSLREFSQLPVVMINDIKSLTVNKRLAPSKWKDIQ